MGWGRGGREGEGVIEKGGREGREGKREYYIFLLPQIYS